jgi:regulatory protein
MPQIDDGGERRFEPGNVTAIVRDKGPRATYSIFVDGEYVFKVTHDTLLHFGLKKGRALTFRDLELIHRQSQTEEAFHCANRLLSYRLRSVSEMRDRLRRKHISEDVIDETITVLSRSGMLDDVGFAESFARDRLVLRGYGPRRVYVDLRRLGVDRAIIDSALEAVSDEARDSVHDVAHRRWRRLTSTPNQQRRKKKLYDYLLRRGFSYAEVCRAVDRVTAADPSYSDS